MSVRQVAVVTGSGKRRVGWHVADALAQHGYAVAVHYHYSAADAQHTVQEFRDRGRTAAAFQADLTDDAQVQRLFQDVIATFGRIDVLVNCAAIWFPKPLEQLSAADVRQFFDINTLGTFLCCQRAGLVMVKQPEGGCIVNVGDWAVARPYPDYAAYFTSKGAIPALTAAFAVELAERNPRVRVNCLLPGPVMLPDAMSAEERERVIASTLVKQEGRPENVAQAVLAMVQNEFITGASLAIDGGRTIYGGNGQ